MRCRAGTQDFLLFDSFRNIRQYFIDQPTFNVFEICNFLGYFGNYEENIE